jgi:hypothetical protein
MEAPQEAQENLTLICALAGVQIPPPCSFSPSFNGLEVV